MNFFKTTLAISLIFNCLVEVCGQTFTSVFPKDSIPPIFFSNNATRHKLWQSDDGGFFIDNGFSRLVIDSTGQKTANVEFNFSKDPKANYYRYDRERFVETRFFGDTLTVSLRDQTTGDTVLHKVVEWPFFSGFAPPYDPIRIGAIERGANGDIFLIGQFLADLAGAMKRVVVMARLDAQGELIWASNFLGGGIPFSPTFWVPTTDGGAYLQMTNASNIRFYYVIGPDGKVTTNWSDSGYTTSDRDALANLAGGYWRVTGPMMTPSTPTSDAIGFKSITQILQIPNDWAQYYTATVTSDGGLIGAARVAGQLQIFKTDPNLVLEWTSGPLPFQFVVSRLLELPNCEGFLATGSRGSHLIVSKIGCEGSFLSPTHLCDVEVSSPDSTVLAQNGSTFWTKFWVKNAGTAPAEGIEVMFEPEPYTSLQFIQALPTAGTIDPTAKSWTINSVAAGDSVAIQVEYKALALTPTTALWAFVSQQTSLDFDSYPYPHGPAYQNEDDIFKVRVVVGTATGEAEQGSFSLTPNPASGRVIFSGKNLPSGDFNLLFFNQLGVLLKKTTLQNAGENLFEISLDDLPKGVFWVSVEGRGGVFKLVKI